MIKEISIENFKSIEKQSVTLADFSVLIGENGAGKTNLIYAISLLRAVILGSKTDEAYTSFALIPSELINKKSTKNTFQISMCVTNGDEKKYFVEFEFILQDDVSPRKNLRIHREKLETQEPESSEKKVIFDRLGEDVKVHSREGVSVLKVDSSVSAISVISDVVTAKVKEIFENIFITEADISKRIPLEDRVTRVILRLRKDPQSYQSFLKIIKTMIPTLTSLVDISDEVSKVISTPQENEYKVLFTEESWRGQLSLKAGSHGDLRTLYFIALALYAPNHSTLIIEEIENGIHTKRTKNLIEFLEKISYKDEKQFLVSTHSPRIINKIRPDDLILVRKIPNEGSSYKLLTEVTNSENMYEFLEKGGEITEILN